MSNRARKSNVFTHALTCAHAVRSFEGVYFGAPLGWFIDTISGVSDDIVNEVFWAFLGHENDAFCDFQVGESA